MTTIMGIVLFEQEIFAYLKLASFYFEIWHCYASLFWHC